MTLDEYVLDHSEYRTEDVSEALKRLIDAGFLIRHIDIAVQPSPIGERLIAAIVGHEPHKYDVPDLPHPPWEPPLDFWLEGTQAGFKIR